MLRSHTGIYAEKVVTEWTCETFI